MTNENRHDGGGGWLGTAVRWLVIGVVAIMAFKLVLAILGAVLGMGAFLLFTIAPVVLVGWVLWKAVEAFSRRPDRQAG